MSKPEERTEANVRTVVAELRRARGKHEPFQNISEGARLLGQRYDMLFMAAIKGEEGLQFKRATQVAAMAIRFMDDLFDERED